MCCFERSFYLFGSLWVSPPSPLLCPVALREVAKQQGRRLNTSYLTDKNHIIKEGLKTPPLCFVTQNIGEVARSDGGVKNRPSSAGLYWSFTLFSYPLKEHFRLKYSGLWEKTKKESIGEKTKSTCDQTATDAYT